MKSTPVIHQCSGVVWTPDDLKRQHAERGQELGHSGHAVAITLPRTVWEQFNGASVHSKGLATLVESDKTGEFYLALLVQVSWLQMVSIVPMSSALARAWYREAVKGGGEFQLAVTVDETEELAMLNAHYAPPAADVETILETLEHIDETSAMHDAATHFDDLRKAVAAMCSAGADMTLVPRVNVEERWVVTVGAADWPPVPAAADGVDDQSCGRNTTAVVH